MPRVIWMLNSKIKKICLLKSWPNQNSLVKTINNYLSLEEVKVYINQWLLTATISTKSLKLTLMEVDSQKEWVVFIVGLINRVIGWGQKTSFETLKFKLWTHLKLWCHRQMLWRHMTKWQLVDQAQSKMVIFKGLPLNLMEHQIQFKIKWRTQEWNQVVESIHRIMDKTDIQWARTSRYLSLETKIQFRLIQGCQSKTITTNHLFRISMRIYTIKHTKMQGQVEAW